MAETAFYRILVAAETDATQYYGPEARRPALLDESAAGQLLSHLAADLKALLPEISDCSLITAGAMYDQTQLLQPAYPVFRALEDVCLDTRSERFRAGLVSIGARDGAMPVLALQPDPDVPPGLLQLLPVVVHGPAARIEAIGQAMEYRFLEEGQLSAHSANWLQSAFGVTIPHARFMTVTDLLAMLRLQLDHFGFLPLWDLLDAALAGTDGPLAVESARGHAFEWRDGAVHAAFYSFDRWARSGPGAALAAERQALAAGYAEWTRELRQYLTTLNAHGLAVVFHHPDGGGALEGSFFEESGLDQPGSRRACVTEQSYGDLGTIAVTVVHEDAVRHFYPLTPAGLNDIHDHVRRLIPAGYTVAFPGSLLYDENERRLVADSRAPSSTH
jgi:hypothetical protein